MDSPAAASKTIRLRTASAWGVEGACTQRFKVDRASVKEFLDDALDPR